MWGSRQRLKGGEKKAMASVCKVTGLAVARLWTSLNSRLSHTLFIYLFIFPLRRQACQDVRAGQRSKCTRHGVPRRKTTKKTPEYLKSRVQVGDLNVKENNVGIVLTHTICICIYIHTVHWLLWSIFVLMPLFSNPGAKAMRKGVSPKTDIW